MGLASWWFKTKGTWGRNSFFLSPSLQTEEDYIPYPSVHEVQEDRQRVKCCPCHATTINTKTLFLSFAPRFSAAEAPFRSFCCPSLEATGSRGPTTSQKNPQTPSSLPVPPPTSNWRQTARPKSIARISWARWGRGRMECLVLEDNRCLTGLADSQSTFMTVWWQ